MELIVGTNTYITVAEADEIVASEYLDGSAEADFWGTLSDDSAKAVLIRRSTSIIDKSLFLGVKADINNKLSFPRIIDTVTIDCPYDIKVAIIAQGIKSAMLGSKEEIKLQDLGVKSYEVEGAKISFSDKTLMKMDNGVYREIYEIYLARWTY